MTTKKKTVEDLVVEQTETVTEEEEVLISDGTESEITTLTNTHIVSKDETWVSISELYRGNKSNNAYAKELIAKNGDTTLTIGRVITL